MKNTYKTNLNLIKALDALLETSSVSKAAELLSITQPAMSNLLNQLRKLFDDEILIRRKKSMIPTQKALMLQKQLKQALPMLESLLFEKESFNPKTSERNFVIAASDQIEYLLLPALFKLFAKEAPKARITVKPIHNIDKSALYENQSVDIGIGWSQAQDKRLQQHILWVDSSVCIARKNHPLLSRPKKVSLQDYLACEHVLMRPSHLVEQSLSDLALQRSGNKRNIALQINNILPGLLILKNTNLIATGPLSIARKAKADFNLEHFDLPFEIPTVPISMIWHEMQSKNPAHQWLREIVQKACWQAGLTIENA